jgi:cytochrome d ubiquinol oxidase subunit I
LAVTTVLILRHMSRRFRAQDGSDDDVPYGPSGPNQQRAEQPESVVPA